MAPSAPSSTTLAPSDVAATPLTVDAPAHDTRPSTGTHEPTPAKAPMAPSSSRMNLASLLQSEPEEPRRLPPPAQTLPPLPPPSAPYPPSAADPSPSYGSGSAHQHSHSHSSLPPPNYPQPSSSSSQNYPPQSSQYGYSGHGHGPPPPSQSPSAHGPPSQSQHHSASQSGGHGYHQGPLTHSYAPSPTHTQHSGPPPAPSSNQPQHHPHQYHQHSHQLPHHHVNSHPSLHPHPAQGHSHLPNHTHPVVHHQHAHHHPHTHHAHGHQHTHPHPHTHHQLSHPHSHVHVIHTHPPSSSSAPNAPSSAQQSSGPQPGPASSSSVAGSPPGYPSHAFSNGPPAGSTRGPQPIIPLNSTPAPRSPVAFTGASRSPSAPYPIYGAGAALAGGRRSPLPSEYSNSGPQSINPSGTSSGSRRNTLTSGMAPSGPQAIEPVPLRDYPPYPGSGSAKHMDDGAYPPPFSAPVYGSRPESPQTQTNPSNRSRRGAAALANRSARSGSTKRSIGGHSEAKRALVERSREREKEMEKEREKREEREEQIYRESEREREREKERDRDRERDREHERREREYEEARSLRERERERQAQHEMDMGEGGRDPRRGSINKRPVGFESEFAKRPPTASEWERLRDPRDRGRMPREQEREWRRDEEDPRQGAPALVQSKHLPPIMGPMQGYSDGPKQPHIHSHGLPIPALQPSRPLIHHYVHPHQHQHAHATPPPAHQHSALALLPPIWLGTCVYPNLPFPVCLPPALSRSNLTSEGYKPYQYTILVPTGFLPLQPATRVPHPTIPLWGDRDTGYTDDSNLLLAAVHSGRTSWSDIRKARRAKQDAKIIVGVWVGGANGGRNARRAKGGAWEGGPGAGQLVSSSWGNSHDGGGMEIVEVVWMEPGSAHAPHRPNRRERMEQYAKRRADLELIPPVKRDRIDTWYLDSDEEDASVPAKRVWDVGETIVFGKGGTTSGFVYDPHTLRSVVFEESNERSTKRRKSRKNLSSDAPVESGKDLVSRRDIVLENDDEQYILASNPPDKEDGKARKYTLSTLSPKSKKTEVLRKSLTEEDVAFLDKGLCVWLKEGAELKPDQDDPSKDADAMDTKGDKPQSKAPTGEDGTDTDRKGWFCHVRRWKFAADDLTSSDAS